jgi:hypothetical protein
MNYRNHLAVMSAATLGVSLLAAGVLVPQASASADCSTGDLCAWTGASWTLHEYDISDFGSGCVDFPTGIRSAVNEYGQTVSLYDYNGDNIAVLADHGTVSDLSTRAYHSCVGTNAAMNHNETVLLG